MRRFSGFNTSLLGIHYWRLLTGEASLLSKVFKGRYYPRRSVSDASVGFSPSYAWRRILSAKYLVTKGVRWRIRNIARVRIWLPGSGGFKPQSHVRVLDSDVKVSELIDLDIGCWNRDLVKACFDPVEATQILNIPLSLRRPDNELIWNNEKDGVYSMTPTYHIIFQDKLNKNHGPSCVPDQNLWSSTRRIQCRGLRRIMFREGVMCQLQEIFVCFKWMHVVLMKDL